jgi:uncharacterized protein (TIGR02246 family)
MTDVEIAEIEAEVREVAQTFIDGFNELDMAKVVSVSHPDHTKVPYAGEILDRSGFQEFLDGWVEDKESWQGDWVDTHIRVLSPDLAAFSGTYSVDMTLSDGERRHYPSGAMVGLFERTEDGWRWSIRGSASSGYQLVEEG